MLIPRIYIDTSVVGGCLDEEFERYSTLLFADFRAGRKIAVVSDLLLLELEEAPESVRGILAQLPEDAVEYVFLSPAALELAEAYLQEGIVAEGSLSDARHVAIASVERVNVLVSWNFKHIVNLRRIRLYQAVNLKLGYPLIEIRSPREVLDEEEAS